MWNHVVAGASRRRLIGSLLLALLLTLPAVAQPLAAAKPPKRTEQRAANENARVVGGNMAYLGEYPFVVALLDTSKPGDVFLQQFCGGSLIGARYVVTAAHCTYTVDPSQLRVLAGRTDLRGGGGQERGVVAVTRHPLAAVGRASFDVAVLTLDRPFQFDSTVSPVTLVGRGDSSLQRPKRLALVAGWGSLTSWRPGRPSARARFPNNLRSAALPIAGPRECASANRLTRSERSKVICAGSDSRDSCQGDSGGPLFAAAHNRWVLIGIVSRGVGCAVAGKPGAYTKLSYPAINDWVRAMTGT